MSALATTLRDAFHRPSTRAYQVIDGVVSALIALSVAILVIDVALPAEPHPWLRAADRVILVFFAVELVLRVATYRPPGLDVYALTGWERGWAHVTGRLRYLARPMSLVDLLTVVSAAPGLRGLRAIRLLRLLRHRNVLRYANPFEAMARAFSENAALYVFGTSVFGITVLIGAVALFLTERGVNPSVTSMSDALWWSVVTVTTVGFGDIVPKTGTGRIIGATLMFAGMGTLALFAGIVSSSLMSAVVALRLEAFRMSGTVGHVVVCGYEAGGRLLLDALLDELGPKRPIVLFGPGERPADVPPSFQWLEGDPSKESELDKVRLADADALILVGSRKVLPQAADAWTILVAFTARRYLRAYAATRQRPVYVVVEILDSENVDHARTAGADEVVETRRLGFTLLTHAVGEPGTATLVRELADLAHHSVRVGACPMVGRYADLAASLLAQGVAVIGVRDAQGKDHIAPPPDLEVGPAHHVLYIGEKAVLPAASRR